MKIRFLLISSLLTISVIGLSQAPKKYHSGEIRQQLEKLNVLGSVLYLAAHPDDENTRMIAYMANEKLLRTAYLSTTRGDGGQNLIGPEIREGLGLIRTQELLAARRIDGGQQFFTRANDFGYSKHPDETLNVWEKDKVLADYVRIIRQFRPDVIITRFSTKPGVTHGHHTTSAILAKEAFKLAGDPNAYPDQLDELEVWQPSRLFWNTSWWFYRNSGQKMDTSAFITLDVGAFNPNLGISYTEMAASSRSQHKSQGFGATGTRGSEIEYLEQWDGEPAKSALGGMDLTWGRVTDANEIPDLLELAAESYDPNQPEEALRALYQAREAILKLDDQFWKEIKLNEIDEVVRAITGTYLEVVSGDYSYVEGDTMQLKLEAITRSDVGFELLEVVVEPWNQTQSIGQSLQNNEKITNDFEVVIQNVAQTSHPYWLVDPATVGMYTVNDPELIGTPENPSLFNVRFVIKWEEQYLEYRQPISFKKNDPVEGEVYRPVVLLPPVTATVELNSIIFSGPETKQLQVRLRASKRNSEGVLKVNSMDGWTIDPQEVAFEFDQKGAEQLVQFNITPDKGAKNSELSLEVNYADGSKSSSGLQIIDYKHIPVQTLLPEAKVKLTKLDMEMAARNIGYIMGAGDAIPDNLRNVGFNVELLDKDQVAADLLKRFDAVVLGVRAFNTVDWLAFKNQELFEYVKNGGTVIVQYNTSFRLVTEEISPIPLKLSRERVTVEEAKVTILEPRHPAMNFPNKITSEDFDGWVQERGLYFPNEWDKQFIPILSSNDPGEPERKGGLLIGKYGKGYFVYTGYSWFRELPAGVPGAYRIFSNLLSLGKQ